MHSPLLDWKNYPLIIRKKEMLILIFFLIIRVESLCILIVDSFSSNPIIENEVTLVYLLSRRVEGLNPAFEGCNFHLECFVIFLNCKLQTLLSRGYIRCYLSWCWIDFIIGRYCSTIWFLFLVTSLRITSRSLMF